MLRELVFSSESCEDVIGNGAGGVRDGEGMCGGCGVTGEGTFSGGYGEGFIGRPVVGLFGKGRPFLERGGGGGWYEASMKTWDGGAGNWSARGLSLLKEESILEVDAAFFTCG